MKKQLARQAKEHGRAMEALGREPGSDTPVRRTLVTALVAVHLTGTAPPPLVGSGAMMVG